MEALVPAFLLAILSQLGDRSALFTAILSDRYGRPLTVALGAAVVHFIGNCIVAAAAISMTSMLTPNAQSLLISLALLSAGASGLWPRKEPSRFEKLRLGAFLSAIAGTALLSIGDRTQFFTFAFAMRGEPWFAAAGAILGASAIAFIAAVVGEASWRLVPVRAVRLITATIFLIAGSYIGLGALRLL